MGYYAVFWEMQDRPVLLVGGGNVADEKIHKLVDAGARVTIIAPEQQVADEARSRDIWVNSADDVANCDFILPSLAKRGQISIATSTGGSSPALARWLRERMEEFLSDDVVALGDLLAEVRVLARTRDRECAGSCELAETPPPLLCKQCPNRIQADSWQQAIDDELQALLRAGNYAAARERIIHSLGIDQPLKPRATAEIPAGD